MITYLDFLWAKHLNKDGGHPAGTENEGSKKKKNQPPWTIMDTVHGCQAATHGCMRPNDYALHNISGDVAFGAEKVPVKVVSFTNEKQ